ncbi:MAG: hypothetical protein HYX76_14550 [Acidobacteria bacterium]|nr:hypothetical protein [Acidobacteriota bacterium]
MSRLFLVLVWIVTGHLTLFGLYGALISVPESSFPMVALSGSLVILLALTASVVETGAMVLWVRAWPTRIMVRRGAAMFPAFLLALGVFAIAWWLTGRAFEWTSAHAGEIDAWLMMRGRTTRTAWVHRVTAALLLFVRYPLALSLATGLIAFCVHRGYAHVRSSRWITCALSRGQLGSIALTWLLLLVMPLKALAWRPKAIPPNAIEFLFVVTKLGLIFLIVNLGWALVLRAAAVGAATAAPSALPGTSDNQASPC